MLASMTIQKTLLYLSCHIKLLSLANNSPKVCELEFLRHSIKDFMITITFTLVIQKLKFLNFYRLLFSSTTIHNEPN